ncbi:MAG: NAD(P)-dependent oxidoreductase [Bacteroidota bacterium]
MAETKDFSPKVLQMLHDHFYVTTGSVKKEHLKQRLNEVDIFWFRLAYQLKSDVISADTKCKFLVSPVTGIDHIDEELCHQYGIRIICLRGEKEFLKEVRATAEHTILLALMLLRNASDAFSDVKEEKWRRDLFRGNELYKKNIGIVGLGRLGAIVAEYLHSFGCKIGYYDIEEKITNPQFKKYDSLQACIERSDLISIHIPYNSSTRHLFDRQVLSYFDATKWLINTSRGGIIDEKALLVALEENNIAGAALDVLDKEPNIEGNSLINFAKNNSNLIITPHIGGSTYESFEKTELFLAKKLINLTIEK